MRYVTRKTGAILCLCLLSACSGAVESVEIGPATAPTESEGVRRVRQRQNLTYYDGGSDELDEIHLDPTTSNAANDALYEEIATECAPVVHATCPSSVTQDTICQLYQCTAELTACLSNEYMELATATETVEVGAWRVPPQSAEVRAALAEFSVYSASLVQRAVDIEAYPVSGTSCSESTAGGVTRVQRIVDLAFSIQSTATEAANLALELYTSLANAEANSVEGARISSELRVHAGRLLLGGRHPTEDRTVGISVCDRTSSDMAVERATRLIRDSGVAFELLDNDLVSTASMLQSHVLPRLQELGSVGDGSLDTVLAEEGLSYEDFSTARAKLVQEVAAFLQHSSRTVEGADIGTFDVFASTRNEPVPVAPARFASRMMDPGNAFDWSDRIPNQIRWTNSAERISLPAISTAVVNIADRISAAYPDTVSTAQEIISRARVQHDGWFYAGTFDRAGVVQRGLLAYSEYDPSELLVVDSEEAVSCLTLGHVEGTPCTMQEFAPNTFAFSAVSETDSVVANFESSLVGSNYGRVAHIDSYSWGFAEVPSSVDSRRYIVRRRSGGSAAPGRYRTVGIAFMYDTGDTVSTSRSHAVPDLIEQAGALLAPSVQNCAEPSVVCGDIRLVDRVPLETDTNDNGNLQEDSWRTYLDLAETSAQEADLLGAQAADEVLQLSEMQRAAAERLEDICGGPLNLGPLFQLATDNPGNTLDELIALLEDGELRGRLERCLGDGIIDLAVLGDVPVCLWRSEDGVLCGVNSVDAMNEDETPLACPSVSVDETCETPGENYEAIRLSAPEQRLGLFQTPEPDGAEGSTPSVCSQFRDLREAIESSSEPISEDEERLWRNLFVDSEMFSPASLRRNAPNVVFEHVPGSHGRIAIGERTLMRTGNISIGASVEGVCSVTPDEMYLDGVGCSSEQSSSLLCGNRDCSDLDTRGHFVIRMLRGAYMARWLGQMDARGFNTPMLVERTADRRISSYIPTHSGGSLARGTGFLCGVEDSVVEELEYIFDLNAFSGLLSPGFSRCRDAIRDTERFQAIGFSFPALSATRPHQRNRRAAYDFVQGLRRVFLDGRAVAASGRDDSGRNQWEEMRTHGTVDASDMYRRISFVAGFSHNASFVNTDEMWNRQVVLDGLELLCYGGSSRGGGAIRLPTTVAPQNVGEVASVVESAANGIRETASRMIVERIPEELAAEFSEGSLISVPIPFDGELGQAAAAVRSALLQMNSGPAALSEELDGVARDLRMIQSAIRISELRDKLAGVQLAQEITGHVFQCALAVQNASGAKGLIAGGIGTALLTCANSVANVAFAISRSGLTAKIDNEQDRIQLTQFVQGAADRGARIRQTGDAIISQHNALNATLDEFWLVKTRARREALRVLNLVGGAAGERVSAEAAYLHRHSATRQRYESARRNALQMAFLATQAIEQRFAVDLQALASDLALVEAPASWVGELCTMTAIAHDGSDANTQYIGEYIRKLRATVESFRIDYPHTSGHDRAVVSLRDDVLHVTDECLTASDNLVGFSDQISTQRVDSPWYLHGCAVDSLGNPLPNCIDASMDSIGVEHPQNRVQDIVFGPRDPLCEGTCDCSDGSCGWQNAIWSDQSGVHRYTGPTLRQELRLQSGRHHVIWNVRAQDGEDLNPFSSTSDYAQAIVRYGNTVAVVDRDGDTVGYFDDSAAYALPGLEWIQFVFEFDAGYDGLYYLDVRPDNQGLGSVDVDESNVTIAGISVSEATSPARLSGGPFNIASTDAMAQVSVAGCEDLDGSEFRDSEWARGCVRLCDSGIGDACDPVSAQELCYWESGFTISQHEIDRGRLFGSAGFARGNYNYRTESIGLNFVGSNLRQCEGSVSSAACFSGGFVPYSIVHQGPFDVRGYNGELYSQPLFSGVVEHARGLAMERYVTNPVSSADRSLLEPYMQNQLRGRPLAGQYRIRIWDEEGVNFDAIEDVQIILDYGYWTRLQ